MKLIPKFFLNDTKKEVLQQQVNAMSRTYVGDKKINKWIHCSCIWKFCTLKSSLQSSKRRFWTSKCTFIKMTHVVKTIDDSSYIKHIFTKSWWHKKKNLSSTVRWSLCEGNIAILWWNSFWKISKQTLSSS